MTKPTPKASKQIQEQGRVELPFSYNFAATRLGLTRNHVRLVCTGERKSQRLIAQLDDLLRDYERGIGSN